MPYKNIEDRRINRKKYYEERKEEFKIYYSQKYKNNPEKIKECNRKYREKNPEKVKKWRSNRKKERNKTDIKFNISRKISAGIRTSLKKNKNGYHWEDLVGYTLGELKKHLEQTIPKGYCWQDAFNGVLHIDHIIPISAFNFTKSEHIDFKRCWALDNLQLLPAKENMTKHNKINKPFQPSLQL